MRHAPHTTHHAPRTTPHGKPKTVSLHFSSKRRGTKSNDGLTVLINFLDEHLAKDDLTDSLEKFEDFDDFYRTDGQSMMEYIAIFDSKYKKIEKKTRIPRKASSHLLGQKSQEPQSERGY